MISVSPPSGILQLFCLFSLSSSSHFPSSFSSSLLLPSLSSSVLLLSSAGTIVHAGAVPCLCHVLAHDAVLEARRGAAKALTNLAQGLSCPLVPDRAGGRRGSGKKAKKKKAGAGGVVRGAMADQLYVARAVERAVPEWHMITDDIISMYFELLFTSMP